MILLLPNLLAIKNLKPVSNISALVAPAINRTDFVPAGETCFVITKKSPFFIVGGGQVPDNGWIRIKTC